MRRDRFERVTTAAGIWAIVGIAGALLAGVYPFGAELTGLVAGVAGGSLAYYTTGAR